MYIVYFIMLSGLCRWNTHF